MQQDKEFSHQTNIYRLYTKLSCDNRLFIQLKDFNQMSIYEKQYMENDGSGDINKKVELHDVFSSLTDTDKQKNQEGQRTIKQYQFGTIIKCGQIPCYKIQSQGRITTYTSILDRKTGKQTILESHLRLEKVGQITQIQQSSIGRQIQNQRLIKILANIIKQKQALGNKVQQVTRKTKIEINQLNKKLAFINEQIEIDRRKRKIQKSVFLILFLLIIIYFWSDSKVKYEKIEKLQRNDMTKRIRNLQVRSQNLQVQIFTTYVQQLELLKQKIRQFNNFGTLNLKNVISPHEVMIGLWQPYYQKFSINQRRLQNLESGYTQFIFNQKVKGSFYVFKIKILKMPISKHLCIGVVDYQKQKTKRYSYNSNNAITYCDWNSDSKFGRMYPQNKQIGNGYSQGQTVKVYVNLQKGSIQWYVGGVEIANNQQEILSDKSRQFRPYIEMYTTGTIVQWIE